MTDKRIVVVGGVAGGATAAARLRRLNENSRITVFERGPHVSFANCGLPYYVGGEIAREEDLLLQTPEGFYARYRVDVRVRHEVVSIDRAAREVEVRDLERQTKFREPYDALILSPGASPVRPPIPGIDREGIFTVRNVPDVVGLARWIEAKNARTAVVVGGGYIGLEMAEQLRHRGLAVVLAEALGQVMAAIDSEMAAPLVDEMRANDVEVRLNDGVAAFEAPSGDERAACCTVVLRSGARLPADVVVLSIGVRPETVLARNAGLEIGPTGGIRVDDGMRTSDPAIWAVGDAVEVRHFVTGEPCLLPLAGPANRQARVAADRIEGRDSRYAGAVGTGILRVFGLTAAGTGATEGRLRKAGIPFRSVHLHPPSHASYYPGAALIALKVLFDPATGRVLGAQAVGRDGVDKRIDVFATAIRAGLTVDDLADLELAYAPPFGSAKDPVNLAGWAAGNLLRGDVETATWDELPGLDPERTLLLDVRTPEERAAGAIPGSAFIPLHELRDRLGELPRDREIVVYCSSGQRSYYACRTLTQHGFRARNLSGAYLTWSAATTASDGERR